jgi:serine/threonine protein phosphatase 1
VASTWRRRRVPLVSHLHMPAGRLIAIGDVHGCIHGLEALLEAIAPQADDELVFLGDLIDQGTGSREVLELILQLQQQCRVVLIKGNHEEMLYAARESEEALRFWERCGGVAMLNGYRYPGGKLDDILASHWRLLDQCVPYFETADFIFTHANYAPDLPMAEQPGHLLRWSLFDANEVQPHISGKPVIVGHTEQKSGELLDLGYATCIDTAGWRYGWITALDVASREVWQASRWGVLRDAGEAAPGDKLARLLRKPAPLPESAGVR